MERDTNNDELELFIKQKADQYQMYPTERAWKAIYHSLHPKGKWFTIGGALLLFTGMFFFVYELVFSGADAISRKSKAIIYTAPAKHSQQTNQVSVKSVPVTKPGQTTVDDPSNIVKITSLGKGTASMYSIPEASSVSLEKETSRPIKSARVQAHLVKSLDRGIIIISPFTFLENSNDDARDPAIAGKEVSVLLAEGDHSHDILSDFNWLQEMAAIRLTPVKKSPFNLQFYFSPTISYRRLVDNKNSVSSNMQNIPLASNHFQVDRFVDHKPAIGVELGSNILFSAGKNLTIKSGLQLNYSRYTIKAYKFYFEKASIALNTVGPVADTLTAYTSIRNFGGYSPEQLQNQYLQVSMPIGAELKLLGNKRLQLNIAGTIQPSYLLFNDIYLLSTDYINYAKEPSLVRKWNVNTSMEAFISYKMGGVRWQVGPQFRYQLISSYNDRYPIKEYLMEYGVKIGVSKTLK